MNTKHTPGPWNVTGYGYTRDESSPTGRRVTLLGADSDLCEGFLINVPNATVCEVKRTRGLADARLIAAAPNLLQALTALLAHSANVNTAFYVAGNSKAMRAAMDGQKQLLDQARAAIAAVKGGAS